MLGFGDPRSAIIDVHDALGARAAIVLPILAATLFFLLLVYRRSGGVWATKPAIATS